MTDVGNLIDATADEDMPCCPACGYALVGLTSRRCPKCGQALTEDLSAYRPSRSRTPWSAVKPLALWRGAWPVLRRPVATIKACVDPERVTLRRAIAFAAFFAAAALTIWGPLREYILAVHVLVRDWGDPSGFGNPFSFAWRQLHDFRWRWVIPSLWLAWAFSRWMILFVFIALTLPGVMTTSRSRLSQRLCAVLIFSPWFFVLDLMCSMTIWAAVGSCVPEPNSMFVSGPQFDPELIRLWVIRLIVPVPLIGMLFFRSVLRWRWPAAVGASFLLILPAMYLWLVWDQMFMQVNLYHLVGM